MKAIVPLDPGDLGGESITLDDSHFEVLAERKGVCLIEFHDLPKEVGWFEEFDLLYCELQYDGATVKVVREATYGERVAFRVPLWIQGEDIPECCGQPMFFIGQIDDDMLCTEPPEGAELWWHDAASFYVFTCPKCLEVKAVGQQF